MTATKMSSPIPTTTCFVSCLLLGLVVDRGAATARQKHVQPLASRIKGGGVSACLGRYLLDDGQRGGVHDVNDARLADRDVESVARPIEPDCIRLAGDWC